MSISTMSRLRIFCVLCLLGGGLTGSAMAASIDLRPKGEIEQLQVGDVLRVELGSSGSPLRIESLIRNSSGSTTIIARQPTTSEFYIATIDGDYYAVLTNVNGSALSVDTIATKGRVVQEALRIDSGIVEWDEPSVRAQKFEAPLLTEQVSDIEDASEISVHFHYNELVRDEYGEHLDARIEHLINTANMLFQDSGVNITLNGTWSFLSNPHRPSRDMLSSYLYFHSGGKPALDFRLKSGYDLLLLLNLQFPSEYGCMLANIVNPLEENYSEHAIAVVSMDCSDDALARTVGHTMGLQRSHYSGYPGVSAFEFGYGHGEKGEFYTLMPNRDDFLNSSNPLPKKFYKFSSPLLDCGGSPCGIPEGQALAADAVKALNLVRTAAAHSNSPLPDTRHVDDLLAQVTDSVLKQCLSIYGSKRSSYVSTWGDTFECKGYVQDLKGLSGFTTFTNLDIEVNFRDLDLKELEKMPQLKSLRIRGAYNLLSSESLGALSQLKYLSIDDAKLVSIESLNKLSALKELHLLAYGNDFRDIDSLAGLQSLEVLNLEHPHFTDLGLLSELTQLRDVRILGATIETLQPLVNWRSDPVSLDFQSNRITTIAGIEAHTNLQKLDLRFNVGIEDISPLVGLTSLEYLDLGKTNLQTIEPIAQHRRFRVLRLASRLIESDHNLPSFTDTYDLSLDFANLDDIASIVIHLPTIVANAERFEQQAVFDFNYGQAPCWQYNYVMSLRDRYPFQMFGGSCRPGGEQDDYDGDGVSNQDEVDQRRNPFVNENAEVPRALDLFDTDGDGRSDIWVRNPNTFMNYGLTSEHQSVEREFFGQHEGDIPLWGDYDGDGITDIIVRRPSTFMWYVKTSSDPGPRGDYIHRIQFGLHEDDIPFVADFDGDGKDDLGVYRKSTRMWYFKTSSDPGERGDYIQRRFIIGDRYEAIPYVGDFDGDGVDDYGVMNLWEPNEGGPIYGLLRYYSSKHERDIHRDGLDWKDGDILVVADFDGDRISDFGIRRPSNHTWYLTSSIRERNHSDELDVITFGLNEDDIPIVADYDGDGLADIAVRRPSTSMQYILNSSGEPGPYGDGIQRIKFGLQQHYIPVATPISVKMKMLAEQQ